MNPTLDPQVVNLAKAIRQVESKGDFTAKGKSGEYGGYQYTPDTWNADAAKYGVNVPLEKATPQQQNEVAYKKIAELKGQGYNVGQIASIWNSGKPEWEGNVGTNKYGVHYDTPQYVNTVNQTYQAFKRGQAPSILPPTASTVGAEEKDPSLLEDIGKRVQAGGNAIADTISGKINPLSGLLQGAGAIGGGITDVIGHGLNFVTGGLLGKAEKAIGGEVGKLAQTETGQKVVGGIQKFQQAHPELSADIGAIGNIVGGVTAVSGAGAVKNAIGGALGRAVGKDVLESTIADVAPNLTGKAAAKGLARGGTTKSLITGEIRQAIDPADREIAEVVSRNVPKFDKLGTYAEKVNATKVANSELAENLKRDVIESGADRIYSFKELNSKLASLETSPEIVGDMEKTYKKVLDKALEVAKSNPDGSPRLAKISNLFDARKDFDNYVENVFPNLYANDRLTAMRVAVKNIRNGMNSFIEENLPNDLNFRQRLIDQSKLYRAIDNMAPKAVKELGSTRMNRFLNRNPRTGGLLRFAGKAAVTGTTAGLGIEGARKILGE